MKEKLFQLIKIRTEIMFLITTIIAVAFIMTHLIPLSNRKKENCAAILHQYNQYALTVNGKEVLYLKNDTLSFPAAWTKRWVLQPYSDGRLVTLYHDTKLKPYTDLPVSQFVQSYKKELQNQIDSMASESKELHYYLRVHSVDDEGFTIVSKYNIELDSVITQTAKILHILDSIKSSDKLAIISKQKFAVRYLDQHGKETIQTCILKEKAHKGKYLIFQTQNKKTPEHVDILNHQAYLNAIPDYIYTQKYGTIGLEAIHSCKNIQFDRIWNNGWKLTKDLWINMNGYRIQGKWKNDTLYYGIRKDSLGIYTGEMNRYAIANGYGKYNAGKGNYSEGFWKNNQRNGFCFSIRPKQKIRAGEWKNDKYYGERVNYTSNRIYGIDVSKYQHEIGKKKYGINWNQIRIISLGKLSKKKITGNINYKVSFAYIKSTEGKSIYNKYYKNDYNKAKAAGIRVGTYHFFSTTSSATQQANFFLKKSCFHKGDFPPVLDVEPSHEQIAKMGGAQELFSQIRTWLHIVERKTGVKPVLYISQMFVNRYLPMAPDLKHKYQFWIARYGEYKPDVKLAYWQLAPDGRVSGIHGEVDITVFNGYQSQFSDFVDKHTIR